MPGLAATWPCLPKPCLPKSIAASGSVRYGFPRGPLPRRCIVGFEGARSEGVEWLAMWTPTYYAGHSIGDRGMAHRSVRGAIAFASRDVRTFKRDAAFYQELKRAVSKVLRMYSTARI
jgi:hypothetical protein